MRYIDEFIEFKCAPLLLKLNIFPNAKEITEAFGMFNALRQYRGNIGFKDDCVCVVVGDGHSPRLGSVVALRTKYECYSIDPEFDKQKIFSWESNINRLHCLPSKVQDIDEINSDKHVFLMLPHSHVNIATCLEKIKGKTMTIITMDCCFNNSLEKEPDIEYVDQSVLSMHNKIKIWNI
jgi:hypothetical protein